jgi:hypothetical protein
MQTVIGRRGNCFAACIASLLEVDIAEVPAFEGPRWCEDASAWLQDRSGFSLVSVAPMAGGLWGPSSDYPLSRQMWRPPGYAILACRRRGPTEAAHAVVVLDGAIVHDPEPGLHPDRDPYVLNWYVLTPTRATFEARVAEVAR